MTRPNLNAVALVPESMAGAIGSTGFHVLRTGYVEPALLWYLVQSSGFVKAMSDLVLGVLYPAVRPKDVNASDNFKRLSFVERQRRVFNILRDVLGPDAQRTSMLFTYTPAEYKQLQAA